MPWPFGNPYVDSPVLRVFASRIILWHIVPDVTLPDYAHTLMGQAILTEASLSFLGIGMLQNLGPLGAHVAGWNRICGKRALGADLPGSRDHAGRITILSIWGCGARYPGSTFAIAITRRCFAVLAILPISRRFGTGRVRPVGEVVRLQLEDVSYR